MDSASKHQQEILDTQSCKFLGDSCPRSVANFLGQMLVVFTVICASIYNLSTNTENTTLWAATLSTCIGFVVPLGRPLKRPKDVSLSTE